jgi:predicted O-linked N-acetylglucosamine transferase (SPINDLY family)
MGSPHHHYLIADAFIVPPENEIYYSEKVMRIPCNQPIDRKRIIAPRAPTRAEAGLPEDAFVFASFNGMQKVTPRCFARWMSILSQTPGSVLWLLTGSDSANDHLRAAAAQQGVDPTRIVFAPKAPNPQHLARIALADLFLDTLPYGAHSTAADALTMGLPILTVAGKSFASRFCASVVAAAGLGDLICSNVEEYVRRAVSFGNAPGSLRRHAERLRRERASSVLCDVPRLVNTLEDCFWQMQAERERGQTPTPDLANLDVYYDIGAELDLESMETLEGSAYRELYRERLAELHALSPVAADARLWNGERRTPARLSA